MKLYTLDDLGWNGFFSEHFAPYGAEGLVAGRVASEYQHIYGVLNEEGEVLARVAGGLRHNAGGQSDYPVVGDWVAVRPLPHARNHRIEALLPRTSAVSRKAAGDTVREQVLAANIDTILIVQALDADFNLRRLERYLVMVLESKARPVILLNKADLCPDAPALAAEAASVAPGIAIVITSATTGTGLVELQPYLAPGQTVAVVGSSGVGKSTLINRLVGRDIQKTAGVQPGGRGRHRTTRRQLMVLPGGALIIDTPGLRELQPWEASESIKEVFREIEELAARCRFNDCRHEIEPGCAVREAAATSGLDPRRLEGYLKLRAEARSLEERQEKAAQAAARKRLRPMMRAYRLHKPRS
ncbi:MAG: ribosome small subunit-dependent GTPase A [Vicinamibacterales bacterium]